jgi:hypothetical protein
MASYLDAERELAGLYGDASVLRGLWEEEVKKIALCEEAGCKSPSPVKNKVAFVLDFADYAERFSALQSMRKKLDEELASSWNATGGKGGAGFDAFVDGLREKRKSIKDWDDKRKSYLSASVKGPASGQGQSSRAGKGGSAAPVLLAAAALGALFLASRR